MNGIEKNLPYYLALHRTPKLGPIKVCSLIEKLPSIKDIFEQESATLKQFGLEQASIDYLMRPDWNKVENDLAWLSKPNHFLLTVHDDLYPKLLKNIPSPPLLLFGYGDPDILNSPQISVVGSRKPTATGKRIAKEFAEELSRIGLTITSGLAYGIDYQSHLGAVEAQSKTVAVLGNGIDNVYPVKHKSLANTICQNGVVISEFPPLTPPLPQNFPQRNRIISGLSFGTLVIEAAKQSGSLITARFAMEQGREVFAIPGSILNSMSSGCHSLIKQGAKLVETIEDILEEIQDQITSEYFTNTQTRDNEKSTDKLDKKHKKILELIGYEPISIDELVTKSGLTADELCSMLLTMEISGFVQSQLGGSYIRIT